MKYVYVPEILNARLQDNIIDSKKIRELIQVLNGKLLEETDLVAKNGINAMINDAVFEYVSLTRESREIRQVLKWAEIESEVKEGKKKRAYSSLATGRLNSHRYEKSHALL